MESSNFWSTIFKIKQFVSWAYNWKNGPEILDQVIKVPELCALVDILEIWTYRWQVWSGTWLRAPNEIQELWILHTLGIWTKFMYRKSHLNFPHLYLQGKAKRLRSLLSAISSPLRKVCLHLLHPVEVLQELQQKCPFLHWRTGGTTRLAQTEQLRRLLRATSSMRPEDDIWRP